MLVNSNHPGWYFQQDKGRVYLGDGFVEPKRTCGETSNYDRLTRAILMEFPSERTVESANAKLPRVLLLLIDEIFVPHNWQINNKTNRLMHCAFLVGAINNTRKTARIFSRE